MTTSVSPDGKTLLVLTSGYNWWHDKDFNTLSFDEFVFIYDISKGKPVKTQAIKVPNTFMGMAWNPNGKEFYVSGGLNDNVHSYQHNGTQWAEFGEPIALRHSAGLGIGNSPMAAGLGVNQDGTRLLVTNLSNDSVSLVDLSNRKEIAELDLRPGKNNPTKTGVPGGEFPNWVVIKGNGKAYVSSLRDRELVVLDLTGDQLKITQRIPVTGNPGRMILDRSQKRLFVALDNSDKVAVFNTQNDKILMSLDVNKPFGFENGPRYTGSHPNSLALSPDESRLYVTMGGTNSLSVFSLDGNQDKENNSKDKNPRLLGLIPTGWYPSSVSLDAKGGHLYVINALSTAGPNPQKCSSITPEANCTDSGYNTNQYVLQMRHGGLLSLPVPGQKVLKSLTEQVLANNWAYDKGHENNHDRWFFAFAH
ncbi:hypothetical protein MGMO_72c00050 [Methyloglobulus morosus KoM1]|uniref:Uncharacterized protein n=1 Tax=Methyloglobulus morosus KoM1 TaxID=1116472 RepID=V5BW72_9GAMM|nr:YncE family protein [Methyloglobulus morosus]ESS72084.1 hypothetical protein MGMO_72c00050 [Methyloglobulus morosus KoM1]